MHHSVSHKVFQVALASGTEVNVEALHIEPTYAGFDGVPDLEVNKRRLAVSAERLTKCWGERPIHFINPTAKRLAVQSSFATHGSFLPPVTFHVWLTDAGSACRELVVIWFDDAGPDSSIRSIVESKIRDLDWEQLSGEYEP